MSEYTEKFEKMRAAGSLAAKTLDMLTDHINPGVSTDELDDLGYEFIKDHGAYSAPQFYRGFKIFVHFIKLCCLSWHTFK